MKFFKSEKSHFSKKNNFRLFKADLITPGCYAVQKKYNLKTASLRNTKNRKITEKICTGWVQCPRRKRIRIHAFLFFGLRMPGRHNGVLQLQRSRRIAKDTNFKVVLPVSLYL